MSFKCIHIADIHFRGLSRHAEYRESFEDFFAQASALKPDAIFIGGDIVHTKTQGISPELIDLLTWWFRRMSEIAPTHVILGNHDGLISNKQRQDAITPIINALEDDNIKLYKNSGVFPTGYPGINWCVFSCFDEDNWPNVKPVPEDINIALFHGGVYGSTTDINWDIEGEIELSFFQGYDFVFLGDIHKAQYLDEAKRAAYPGSTIQQNYGETPNKGFLFWEIDNKDKFKSTFYTIKHTKPFVTIDWKNTVSKTLKEALAAPYGARFRVKSDFTIPQAEIKHLYSVLKERCAASEIVFKFDQGEYSQINSNDANSILNLRDHQNLLKLCKQFYENQNITDDEWIKIEDLLKKHCAEATKNDSPRNVKWSIKKIKFDNTFSYGKNNLINFENLNGVVGLFGRNRSGKSSIPGTIMYGLFNSTDRGPIKNLHIINTRKGHCGVEIDFSVNGINYRLERQSVKSQNRKGQESAVTHLNFFKLDSDGNPSVDMSGEQRRDTDKILKNLIGTREDFLLTSFASQGEMNAFIKHRATQRKSILTNFLDLDIFEKILTLTKEESIATKAILDKSPEREWNTLILEKGLKLRNIQEDRQTTENQLNSTRSRLQTLKVEAAKDGVGDIVTPDDIRILEKEIKNSNVRLKDVEAQLLVFLEEISSIDSTLNKISNIKNQFSIKELKEKLSSQNDLEKNLLMIENNLEREKQTLETQNKSVKLLEQVPCGDKFPTCKFIKNSHKNKKLLVSQRENIEEIKSVVKASQKSLKSLLDEDLKEKIEKYQQILNQESDYKIASSNIQIQVNDLQMEQNILSTNIINMKDELVVMKTKVVDENKCSSITALKKQILLLEIEIKDLDIKKMSMSESIGLFVSSLQNLEEERKEYNKLLSEWRIFELLIGAVNKKGIPLQILTTQLPKINSEILKILQGVVGFTVELEADNSTNAMDIYINYGDSKRVIECASGMEKMISSLAIRAALINISSLPKSDTLIIDEGFGALDEINVEACTRMLQSLKKWFKNIIVISHVDAVKDSVDSILEITNKDKDSRVYHE